MSPGKPQRAPPGRRASRPRRGQDGRATRPESSSQGGHRKDKVFLHAIALRGERVRHTHPSSMPPNH